MSRLILLLTATLPSWQSQFQKTRFSKSGKTPYNTTVCGLRGHIFASLILKALVWISIGSDTMWQPYCPLGGQYIPHGGRLLIKYPLCNNAMYYLHEMRIKDMSTTDSPTFSDFFLYTFTVMKFRWISDRFLFFQLRLFLIRVLDVNDRQKFVQKRKKVGCRPSRESFVIYQKVLMDQKICLEEANISETHSFTKLSN